MNTTSQPSSTLKGSCLCGAIAYEISGAIGDIVHCHCQTCRKAHASAFSSVAAVDDSDFKIHDRQTLRSFTSSPGKQRFFCEQCGTQIYAKRDDTAHVILRLGSLDTPIASKEKEHIWLAQKADWYTLNSRLPEHDEFA